MDGQEGHMRKTGSMAEWTGATLLTLGGAALLVRPLLHARAVLAGRLKP